MPRYEKLTCDEVKDKASIQNRRRTIGLIPYILLSVLILTITIGVFYTRQGIHNKHKEEQSYQKQISFIQKTNVEMSEELIELQNKREKDKKLSEDKQQTIDTIQSSISSLKKSNQELRNKWNENILKEHEFQSKLDSLCKMNTDLEDQINDLITQHRILKKKIKSKSERLTELQSSIIETETELKLIEEKLNNKRIYNKCFYNNNELHQAKLFHSNCDNITHTLILYKTKSFERFGGYSTKVWNGEEGIKDRDSFLFSLNNLELFPFNNKCPNGVLLTTQEFLPSFGESTTKYDVLVEENHGEIVVYSEQLNCYGETEGETGTLIGCKKAVISNIEVYIVK